MTAGLTPSQERIALGAIAAVKARGWSQKAAVIVIEAGLAESGLLMIASANVPESQKYPHDLLSWTVDGLGHDHASCGYLQQQTGYAWTPAGQGRAMNQTTMDSPNGWGTPAELMDPEKSTAKFLDHLAYVDWQHSSNWLAAQAVQGSASPDGSNYRVHDAEAQAIVAALWGAAPDSNNQQLLTSPEGPMFEILQDRSTGNYYACAPGFWRHITTVAELDGAAASPLCVNGKRVLGRKSATNRKFFQMTQPHLLLRRKTYTGK